MPRPVVTGPHDAAEQVPGVVEPSSSSTDSAEELPAFGTTPEPVDGDGIVEAPEGQDDEPAGERAETLTEVSLAPMVVRVLGDVQILGEGAPSLSTKELSMLTYLALEGDRNKSAIKIAVYGPNAEVKTATWKALVRRFRAKIGEDRFPQSPDGRYRLVEVTTDYARFLEQIAAAETADSEPKALEHYLLAASMVVGQPFGPEAGVDAWAWIDAADNHPRCHMSARIGDAILQGSRLAMNLGRYPDALEIIDRGRVANPYSEQLVMLHVEALCRVQQPHLARRLVAEFNKKMEDEFHVEPPIGPQQVLERMQVAS